MHIKFGHNLILTKIYCNASLYIFIIFKHYYNYYVIIRE
jgi:hypothetical protein